LLVLLLACVASLGGWVLVAPALPKPGAVAAEPPADLDMPQRASVHDAASAAAGRASGTQMRAVAAASRAAPMRAGDPNARCGDDQAPVYADPVPDEDGAIRGWPVQTRPAGVGYVGAQRRVDAALRSTGDPFDAAVADALNVGDLRTPDDRLAALVQDATIADDPRLYALAFSVCGGARMVPAFGITGGPPVASDVGLHSCARLDPRRWAARDPGNAVPWLYALERSDAANDGAGQREALQELGASSRFRTNYGAAAAAVARIRSPDDADLAGHSYLAMQAVTFTLWPPFTGITLRCRDKARGDAAMVAMCEHVADALHEHSDTMLTRVVGASIHKLATGDATRLDRAHAEYKELAEKWTPRFTDDDDAATCDRARRFLSHFVLVGKVGEVEAMKQEVAAQATK
jgi:hypothetical protein